MYLLFDYLTMVKKVKPFMDIVRSNPSYIEYYNEPARASTRASLDDTIDGCTPQFYARVEKIICYVLPFKKGYKILSTPKTPMSAYLPVCACIANACNLVLAESDFETILGTATKTEIIAMNSIRFNFDGTPPAGQKVGLLDEWQIWAFIADPFSRQLSPLLAPNVQGIMDKMIDFFLPTITLTETNGSEFTTREKLRADVKYDFMQYWTQVC